MIRTNALQGNPSRRIAIIQMPRPQRARLGTIRLGDPAGNTAKAWTTISDEAPDSSANWLSYVLQDQARTRQTTPGTLTYTPASETPGMNVAPWNSWLSPNCPPNGADPNPAGMPASNCSKWFLLFGAVTAAAALTYMVHADKR